MRILICGSRTFDEYAFLEKSCADIVSEEQYKLEIPNKGLEVVSGNNPRGADWMGEKWAKKNNLALKLFPAMWNDIETQPVVIGTNYYGMYNKMAGSNRNTKMLEYLSQFENAICIAFDLGTVGTKDMVAKCKKAGIKTFQWKKDKNNEWKVKIWNG